MHTPLGWGDIYWKEFSIYFTICYLGQLGLGFLVLLYFFDFPSHLPFALSGDWIG